MSILLVHLERVEQAEAEQVENEEFLMLETQLLTQVLVEAVEAEVHTVLETERVA
jgi:hypothetical protein